ncbi:ligase-associated DNA damage response endonuclease PdeM [Roseicyclus marinus]|uniref:ligase-associated DNA damage response endonuclease PdeM n=1 Tax=Roseicyclus marinus TaxID=2161673 RepID=UPI002410ABEC|nr:ligase-associated DNA damage response endonuclease PdeM [Roseicyclus marinus]MDG3042038.1 ligase-associated DNA damage response endonuclease PdeM [Roseicyclus marinus]
MNALPFDFRGETLHLLPSGALHWPAPRTLCVADLHLGKSERMARLGGPMLPPYETEETLTRLTQDIALTDPATVICLGDSFDDMAAAQGLETTMTDRLASLMAGRSWVWVLGNHDPGPVNLGGSCRAEYRADPLVFRHIAEPGAMGEISGHYHPKARISLRGRSLSRRCAVVDATRVILPAYGAYTGGLFCDRPELERLVSSDADMLVLGPSPIRLPLASSSIRPARRSSST